MRTARTIFIEQFFSFLSGKDYLCVKYILDAPKDLPNCSDLDLLVASDVQVQINNFCLQHPLISNLKTQTCAERYTLKLYFADGTFLKLDLLQAFQRSGLIYLNKEKCFNHQQVRGQVQTYHCLHLLEHVFLYYTLNGSGIPDKYIQYFIDLPKSHRSVLLSYLKQLFGVQLTELADLAQYDENIRRRVEAQIKARPENKPWRVLLRRLQQWKDELLDRSRQHGRIVTFSGVDGAGKTTLLNKFAQILEGERGERIKMLRHRPGIFPILSALAMGREKAAAYHQQRLPRQGTNKSFVSSLLRFTYYYVDYFIGQWWVQLRYCRQGYTVLYDRYYFDFIADVRRSNLHLPPQIPRQLYKFLLAPNLNFFLYADPESILSRKQELDAETITSLTQNYQTLFRDLQEQGQCSSYQMIRNEQQARSMRQILQWYNTKVA